MTDGKMVGDNRVRGVGAKNWARVISGALPRYKPEPFGIHGPPGGLLPWFPVVLRRGKVEKGNSTEGGVALASQLSRAEGKT